MISVSLTTGTPYSLRIIIVILITSVDKKLCQFKLVHNFSMQKSTSTNAFSNESYSKNNYSDVIHVTSTEPIISIREHCDVTSNVFQSNLMLNSFSVSNSITSHFVINTINDSNTGVLGKSCTTWSTSNNTTNFNNSFSNQTSTSDLKGDSTKLMINEMLKSVKNINLLRNISSKFRNTIIGNKHESLIRNKTRLLANRSQYWLSKARSHMRNMMNKTALNISGTFDSILVKVQNVSVDLLGRNITTSQTNFPAINNKTCYVSYVGTTGKDFYKHENKFCTVICDAIKAKITSVSFVTRGMNNVTLLPTTKSSAVRSSSRPVTIPEKKSKASTYGMPNNDNVNTTLKSSKKVTTNDTIQIQKNITRLFMDHHNYINITNETIHTTNGTMMNAAGRFLTDCLDQMSKMMHCFSVGDLPEPTLNNITFYLYTRKNTNSGELLTFDTDFLDAYDDFSEGYDNDYDEEEDEDYYDDDEDESNLEYYYVDYESPSYYYTGDNSKVRGKRCRTNHVANVTNRRTSHRSLDQSHPLLMRRDGKESDVSASRNHSEKPLVKNFVTFKRMGSKENQSKPIPPGRSLLSSKYFNVNDKTKIIVHGYTQSHTTEPIVQLKDAYLSRGSFNVILVDWATLAAAPCYNVASKYARSVGGVISDLVAQLMLSGINSKSIHIIGFSLGAQAAGFAGSYFTTGHIERITGLDPALPLFQSKDPDDCLDAGDAHFVDIIHTSHILGHKFPLGHADFYPNGGVKQPGCDKSDFICSHIRGLQLFAESVTSVLAFPSVPCDSWELFMNGGCDKKTVVFMGDGCPSKISGLFYLRTRKDIPYSLHANVINVSMTKTK